MTHYLSEEEILLAHFKLIERFGGSHGVRDIKRIKSVVIAPQQEVFGAQQYPDIFEKAAMLARNIIADHPFTDGNKRTSVTVAIMFLERNYKKFKANRGELEDFAVKIAVDHLSVEEISAWFKDHCKSV